MTVYVLTYTPEYETEICLVFSTEAIAEAARATLVSQGNDRVKGWSIEPMDVDMIPARLIPHPGRVPVITATAPPPATPAG